MTILKFPVKINSPKEKVWKTLWDDQTYRKWTSVFCEGSYAEGDWKEGSKMRFLDPKGDGMFAVVKENIPGEKMIIRHLGEVKEMVEEPKDWGDAVECYNLEEAEGGTDLNVELHVIPEFAGYMEATFPKALAILKNVCEGK